ncbi:MAG: Serine/threonine protein kinase, partial [uncultured Rubrobacteraceae bacterium]
EPRPLRRPLRGPPPPRGRRHGRGPPGARRESGAGRGPENPERAACRGRGLPEALPPGGEERRHAQSPERRAGLRPAPLGGRHLLHRDGARARRHPQGAHPARGRARSRRSRPSGRAGRRGFASGPRAGRRPPGREVPEHPPHGVRGRQGRGLWDSARRRRHHALRPRRRPRHGEVHVPRAGDGCGRHPEERPVLFGGRPLRDADRGPPLRGGGPGAGARQARQRTPAATEGREPRGPRGDGRPRYEAHVQGPRPSPRERGGARRRAQTGVRPSAKPAAPRRLGGAGGPNAGPGPPAARFPRPGGAARGYVCAYGNKLLHVSPESFLP